MRERDRQATTPDLASQTSPARRCSVKDRAPSWRSHPARRSHRDRPTAARHVKVHGQQRKGTSPDPTDPSVGWLREGDRKGESTNSGTPRHGGDCPSSRRPTGRDTYTNLVDTQVKDVLKAVDEMMDQSMDDTPQIDLALCTDGAPRPDHGDPPCSVRRARRMFEETCTVLNSSSWAHLDTEEHTPEAQLSRTADACCTEAYKADAYILVPQASPRETQLPVRIIGHQLMAEQRMMAALRQHLRAAPDSAECAPPEIPLVWTSAETRNTRSEQFSEQAYRAARYFTELEKVGHASLDVLRHLFPHHDSLLRCIDHFEMVLVLRHFQ